MVIPLPSSRPSRRQLRLSGQLVAELIVAISILVFVMLPLAYAFAKEQKLCRNYYFEAVAMEIIDGEMEILASGEWRSFREDAQPYPVRAEAAQNLPPGRFVLSRQGRQLRLEWSPDQRGKGKHISRAVVIQ
jgi:hypothetical protein